MELSAEISTVPDIGDVGRSEIELGVCTGDQLRQRDGKTWIADVAVRVAQAAAECKCTVDAAIGELNG